MFHTTKLQVCLQQGSFLLSTEEVPRVIKDLQPAENWEQSDLDLTAWLCKETTDEGNNVLVFCGTKKVLLPSLAFPIPPSNLLDL